MYRISLPLPAADDVDARRLVLRDGSVASVRITRPDDRDTMRRFFHRLSPESLHKRFFTFGEPADAMIARFCDSTSPSRGLTLVAERRVDGDVVFIAVATYIALTTGVAEAAFAVDDHC